jgi:AcrR family transcriptional regulator
LVAAATAASGTEELMRDYDGKTAAERVAERRQRLIEAGYALFGEHGYAGTTIRAVRQRAGLIDRYFGENFADLDALLAAVYDQIVDEELASCRAAIDATPGGSEGGRALVDTLASSLEGDPGRARIKLREVISGGPLARQQRQVGVYKFAALVAELLPPARPDKAQEQLLLAAGIVAATNELLIAWLDGDQDLTRADVVDLVMTMFDAVADRMAVSNRHLIPRP